MRQLLKRQMMIRPCSVLVLTVLLQASAEKETGARFPSGSRSAPTWTIPLTRGTSGAFAVNASLGTPPQNFTLLLSVGQRLLWVPSSSCQGCNQLRASPYNSSASSTYRPMSGDWNDNLTYLIDNDVPVQGAVATDNLKLYGKSVEGDLTAVSTNFGQALEARSIDFTEGYDGVLGLGLSTSRPYPIPLQSEFASNHIIGRYFQAGQVAQAALGIFLPSSSEQSASPDTADFANGALTLGGANPDLFEAGSLCYYSVLGNSSASALQSTWRIPAAAVAVNGIEAFSPTSVSLNSASVWSYLPQADFDALAKQIGAFPVYGSYFVNTTAVFNITFILEGGICGSEGGSSNMTKRITLTQADLVEESLFGPDIGMLLIAPYRRALEAASENAKHLWEGLQGWTLGVPFMQQQYVVLDYGVAQERSQDSSPAPASQHLSPRVGFANKKSLSVVKQSGGSRDGSTLPGKGPLGHHHPPSTVLV